MCSSSKKKQKKKPAPVTKDKPYWDWWNSPQANEGINGNYRLNRLAIGSTLGASQGTSRLKIQDRPVLGTIRGGGLNDSRNSADPRKSLRLS